jgi:AcrR family transcriptional regulator
MTTKASQKNKRLELGDRSKETILDVASRLMSTRGYEGTSISAIAKESSLPASSIYWHFSSKVGVVTAVMDRGNARFYAKVSSLEIPAEAPRFDKLLAIYEQGMNALYENPDFVRLQIILMLNSPAGEVNTTVLRMREQARDGIRAALVQAFSDQGASRAATVAARLTDFVGASFEGIFLAQEAGSSSTSESLRQLARATVALAEDVLSSEAESAGSC